MGWRTPLRPRAITVWRDKRLANQASERKARAMIAAPALILTCGVDVARDGVAAEEYLWLDGKAYSVATLREHLRPTFATLEDWEPKLHFISPSASEVA